MALAIFDLDETLIHGDCATLWSEQMGRLGWVDPQSFMQRNNELMAAYSKGELAMEVFMDFSLEPLIGRIPSPRPLDYRLRSGCSAQRTNHRQTPHV